MVKEKDPISVRFAEEDDERLLVDWLMQPGVLEWFPLNDLREVQDAARIWLSYRRINAVLTALWNGVPCGNATLYIQPYRKLKHQCLFAIIVDEKYRGKGVGKRLIEELILLAKTQFNLELLHLEVYEGNPAIRLYERLGFARYGVHPRFVKESNGRYLNKVLMQKALS